MPRHSPTALLRQRWRVRLTWESSEDTDSDSGGLGVGPKFCISNQLPREDDTTDPRTIFWAARMSVPASTFNFLQSAFSTATWIIELVSIVHNKWKWTPKPSGLKQQQAHTRTHTYTHVYIHIFLLIVNGRNANSRRIGSWSYSLQHVQHLDQCPPSIP